MDQKFSVRTREDMKPVLFDAEAPGPDAFYYMLRGGETQGNITILEPGTTGEEYVKTMGHYHPYDFDETYRVLEGEGLMLLQKRAESEGGNLLNDTIEEFKVVRLKAGDSLTLPLQYGHVLVNIGESFLITRDDSPSDPATNEVRPHADYEPVKQMHGLAYYLIMHDGAPALVRNPLYKEIMSEDLDGIPVIE